MSPEAAVKALISLHAEATATLKAELERNLKTRQAPSGEKLMVHRR